MIRWLGFVHLLCHCSHASKPLTSMYPPLFQFLVCRCKLVSCIVSPNSTLQGLFFEYPHNIVSIPWEVLKAQRWIYEIRPSSSKDRKTIYNPGKGPSRNQAWQKVITSILRCEIAKSSGKPCFDRTFPIWCKTHESKI